MIGKPGYPIDVKKTFGIDPQDKLELYEDEDFVYLYVGDDLKAVYNARKVSYEELLKEVRNYAKEVVDR